MIPVWHYASLTTPLLFYLKRNPSKRNTSFCLPLPLQNGLNPMEYEVKNKPEGWLGRCLQKPPRHCLLAQEKAVLAWHAHVEPLCLDLRFKQFPWQFLVYIYLEK